MTTRKSKFRSICAVLEEIYHAAEAAEHIAIMHKAVEARGMAKRMQSKLEEYSGKKVAVDDDGNWHEKTSGKWR